MQTNNILGDFSGVVRVYLIQYNAYESYIRLIMRAQTFLSRFNKQIMNVILWVGFRQYGAVVWV